MKVDEHTVYRSTIGYSPTRLYTILAEADCEGGNLASERGDVLGLFSLPLLDVGRNRLARGAGGRRDSLFDIAAGVRLGRFESRKSGGHCRSNALISRERGGRRTKRKIQAAESRSDWS